MAIKELAAKNFRLVKLLLACLLVVMLAQSASVPVAVTGSVPEAVRAHAITSRAIEVEVPETGFREGAEAALVRFVSSVANGNANRVVGVYSQEVLALEVRQQPANNPGFVSAKPGLVTQFSLAKRYGTTAFLAHNTSSGGLFFGLEKGSEIVVVYGDGETRRFQVTALERYRALSPNSPYTDFVRLDKPGRRLSSTALFYDIYAHEDRVVLQTCIYGGGNPSWGRLFVIAKPMKEVAPQVFERFTPVKLALLQ